MIQTYPITFCKWEAVYLSKGQRLNAQEFSYNTSMLIPHILCCEFVQHADMQTEIYTIYIANLFYCHHNEIDNLHIHDEIDL